jgi:hypothetical protein
LKRIPDYLFYRLYKNAIPTNKSIPEWSSIFVISITLTFNIFCVLKLLDYDLKSIGESGAKTIPLILIGLNYFVFIYKKRYIDIIKHFDQKNNKLIFDVLVLTYIIGSILFLFYLANVGIKYWIYTIVFILILSQVPKIVRFIK